jgi:uncharacterized protein
MNLSTGKARILLALAVLAGVATAFWWGAKTLRVNSDITASLPRNDKVVVAAQQILRHHPFLDNVFIQISLSGETPNRGALAKAADMAAVTLSESGLVRVVSGAGAAEHFALLLDIVTENLPILFSAEDLRDRVGPLVEPARVWGRLEEEYSQLLDLGSIGQARYFAMDPLGLRYLFLSRLSNGLPFQTATLERGHLFSKDGFHLLLMAQPTRPSRDASFASALTRVLERISLRLKDHAGPTEGVLRMVYAGAFRASLDNENIIRRDTARSLTLVMLSLIPLVLISFRRPWLGLLSAVPATAGTMLAVFVLALTGEPLFAVAIGFGGALIGIAVDHGLAYVILLDRPGGAEGEGVSREVWSVGSISLLSTVAGFMTLTLIDIPLFNQVGLFAALGVGFSALFVHFFFPLLFPRLKGVERKKSLPAERLMDWIMRRSGWWSLGICVALALVLLFFAKFRFNVDLASMNTVSKETLAAEQAFREVWGGLPSKPSIMARGRTLEELFQELDRLAGFMEDARRSSALLDEIPRAMRFLGAGRQDMNRMAWRDFWNPERIFSLEESLREGGAKLGYKGDAFDPFLHMLRSTASARLSLPRELLSGFGVVQDAESRGWVMVDMVAPGPGYEPAHFFESAREKGFPVFDSRHFSRHLAGELYHSFLRMLLIIGSATLVLLAVFLWDWQLLLLSISPVVFSFVATLGTLGLLGIPLSIPSLMLTPLLVGLGLDFGVYFVRCYQRFGTDPESGSESFRVTVMLNGVTTLIGFGSLLLAEHAVLRDAGLSTFLGIFFAMMGAFWIIPPVLRALYAESPTPARSCRAGSREQVRQALSRFRHLETYPRMSARFKILLDPMFPRLAEFVRPGWKILDVGCGYGVPAAWLLTLYPDLEFLACEPNAERVRISRKVLGERGRVLHGGAMDLHWEGVKVHSVLLLDVLHYFDGTVLQDLFTRLNSALYGNGRLVIRAIVPHNGFNLFRYIVQGILRLKGLKPCWRSREEIVEGLRDRGFQVELVEPCSEGRAETWFIAAKVEGIPKAD